MLKKLTIRNFKAIRDMTIEFTPLTVLIGGNSCGKSTVLQALDFLRSAVVRDIPEYLRERGWTFADLKSQCDDGQKKPMEFISLYEFQISHKARKLSWNIMIDFQDKKWIIKEIVKDETSNEVLLSFNFPEENTITSGIKKTGAPKSFSGLSFEASAMKYIDKSLLYNDSYFALKSFLSNSKSYDLLSTDRIRSGKKISDVSNIGLGGENLAHYIHTCMSPEQRKKLEKIVSEFVDFKIELKTYDAGKMILLCLADHSVDAEIDTQHISDGLLRIIAFAAITIQSESAQNSGVIMLDEIEDGINPYLTEKVIELLRGIIKDSEWQIIVTTHSPDMVNVAKPEEIVFLWKDKDGAVQCKNMFSTDKMKRLLNALNPGEVWINFDKDEILERLQPLEKK
jgi:predicted ATPase